TTSHMDDGIIGTSRRTLLRTLIGAASGLTLASSAAFGAEPAAPKEGGLSFEGLLAGEPGFHPRTAAPLPYAELPGFLSHTQLAGHHAEYVKNVETLRTTEDALRSADRGPAGIAKYAEARHRQVANANAVLLHDFYFASLAPARVEVPS